jgi:hypothetical protein
MKLLDEILSDYPRIWNFYRQDIGEKQRQPKYAQRYPLPLGTLSMILDFHKWVNESSLSLADKTGIELSNNIRKTAVGPDPVVMYRIQWLSNNWSSIENKQKHLAKILGNEIIHWHTRIRVKVNDGDIYEYQSTILCEQCTHKSVVRINDIFLCVNVECRNPLTGKWRTWQIN